MRICTLLLAALILCSCESAAKNDHQQSGARTPVTSFGIAVDKAKRLGNGLEERDKSVAAQADQLK